MDRKQCKDCGYFIAGGGGVKTHDTVRFCHYMLYTGKRRAVGENEKCLSKSKKAEKLYSAFEVPVNQM